MPGWCLKRFGKRPVKLPRRLRPVISKPSRKKSATSSLPWPNLARHLQTDPEAAIRRANLKFERRFRFIENELARQDKTAAAAGLEEMEALWTLAKRREEPSRAEPKLRVKPAKWE